MDSPFHSLENLFLQLGLENSPASIDAFVKNNRLQASQALDEASFWTTTQSAFIRECLNEDSDWAEVVDQLNVMLHD